MRTSSNMSALAQVSFASDLLANSRLVSDLLCDYDTCLALKAVDLAVTPAIVCCTWLLFARPLQPAEQVSKTIKPKSGIPICSVPLQQPGLIGVWQNNQLECLYIIAIINQHGSYGISYC